MARGLRAEARGGDLDKGPSGCSRRRRGGRSDLLAERLAIAIATERPCGLISFGVAGALRAGLRIGDPVVGSSVITAAGERFASDEPGSRRLALVTEAQLAEVLGVERLMAELADKQAAGAGALIVDMESQLAARAAQAEGLPLLVLRVVSDEAGHTLPPAAHVAMSADGGVDLAAVLLSLARNPGQISALLRTGRHAGRAFRRLAELRQALG